MRAIDNLLIGLGLGLLFWLLFEPAYQYVFGVPRSGESVAPDKEPAEGSYTYRLKERPEGEWLYYYDYGTGELSKSPCLVNEHEVKCPPSESAEP